MARLVKTTFKQNVACNIITSFEDETSTTKTINENDIVENLRYIEDETVKSVTGKVVKINMTMSNNQKINMKNPVDTFAQDVIINSLTIDASSQYESKIVTVPAIEIVEDAGVENVTSVHCFATADVTIKMEYTNGHISENNLIVGDLLENVRIIGESEGKPDITGNFEIIQFAYNMVNKLPVFTGVVLKDKDGLFAKYDFTRFLTIDEIPQIDVESSEELVDALNNAKGNVYVYIPENEMFGAALSVPSEANVSLQLPKGSSISNGGAADHTLHILGEATISGGGEILNTEHNKANVVVDPLGKLVIEDLMTRRPEEKEGNTFYSLQNFGHMTINGGNYVINENHEGSYASLVETGYYNYSTKNPLVPDAYTVINDGYFSKGLNTVKADDGATVVINGGYFENSSSAVLLNANVLEVNGGEFKALAGCRCLLANDSYGTPYNLGKLTITDGKFIIEDVENTKFMGSVQETGPSGEIKITGGKFNVIVPADYIPEGYACTQDADEEGFYKVLAVN